MLTLGAWYITLLGILFVLVCLFMMLVILIQKPRGGGLSGAFGGAGGAQAAFGAKTGDVLTWFTVFCFLAFLLLAVGLTWLIHPSDEPDSPAIRPADAQTDVLPTLPQEVDASDIDGESPQQAAPPAAIPSSSTGEIDP